MEFKKISGRVKIPVLGIGTSGIGGGWAKRDASKDKEWVNAIRAAIRLGMAHIDTAEMYGAGHSEELVGRAIRGMDRKRLFITTKVWKENLRYKEVISAAKGSLKRMHTQYIDLYLIHWPNPRISLRETMKAMDYLVKKKRIRFIGVSNFSVKLLEEAQSCTRNRIVANEVEYHLLRRGPERGLLEYCRKKGIMLIAYQPLAGGRLAKPGFRVLDGLAKKYGKTQAQIAINWLISKQNVVTIPKAADISHVKENAGAFGWQMDKKDARKLDGYFKRLWFFYGILGRCIWAAKRFYMIIFPQHSAKN